MYRASRSSRAINYLLVGIVTFAGLSSSAFSAIATTQMLAFNMETQQQRDVIAEQLMRADVRQELTVLGVDPADVERRINNLSAAEVNELHGKLASLPAGSGALETVILVMLLLILLEITGVIDIFPKL